MALSGEQWLDRVFRPAVAGVSRARQDRSVSAARIEDALRRLGGQLAAQVEALGDTGVLTDEQESAARAALADAGILPEIRSASASASASVGGVVGGATAARVGSAPPVAATATAEPPRLSGVLPGPLLLGRLEGRPVTLISAELWTDRFVVDLCAETSDEDRNRRKEITREHLEWMRRQRRGEAVGAPRRAPHISPLQALTWHMRDANGTEYSRTGGSGESGEYLERLRLPWIPAPAPDIATLTLLATDGSGAVVLTGEIPVPTQS